MMKKTVFGLVLASMVLLSGCDLDNPEPNFYFVPLQISDVEVPEFFFWNEIHTIQVTYEIPNSCVQYEGFDINTEGSATRYVTCIGAEYQAEACNTSNNAGQATFEFLALNLEPYIFRFWAGEDANGNAEYLEVIVPVRN